MRTAGTYRAFRRNTFRSTPGLEFWPGVAPGIRRRKESNARKLLKNLPPKRVFFITPILAMMVQRGLASGALAYK